MNVKHFRSILIFLLTVSFPSVVVAQPPEPVQPSPSNEISLQLKQVEIEDVLRTLSEKSGYNIVAESGVKGRVSVFLDGVTTLKALDILSKLYGLAYVKEGNIIMVLTAANYEATYGRKFQDQLKTRVFGIKNLTVDKLAPHLSSLKTAGGSIISDSRTNTLIATDVPSALDRVAAMIEILDVPVTTRCFDLHFVSPGAARDVIAPFLSSTAVVVQDPSTSRLLITDAESNLLRVSNLLSEYDRQPLTETRTFQLEFVTIEDAAAQISPLLTVGLGTIQTDSRTGTVFITDLPKVLDELEATIAVLDQKPREVMVEAKILQISLDESNKMGVNWEAIIEDIDHNDFNVNAKFNVLGETDDGVTVTGGVLSDDNYTAMVEMLATHGKTDLLSSPRLMVLNNTEARILVGKTVPYKTVDTREEDGSIRTFEKVVMTDVGVKLFVTPIINSDSVITLRIRPEVSSVTGYSENIPIVEKSETETVVMVSDGVTILIGGLVRDEKRETIKGVPILSRIPILGIPFRSKSTQKTKTELAILLTPHIVSGEVPAVLEGVQP